MSRIRALWQFGIATGAIAVLCYATSAYAQCPFSGGSKKSTCGAKPACASKAAKPACASKAAKPACAAKAVKEGCAAKATCSAACAAKCGLGDTASTESAGGAATLSTAFSLRDEPGPGSN